MPTRPPDRQADSSHVLSDSELKRFIQLPAVRITFDLIGLLGALASIVALYLVIREGASSAWNPLLLLCLALAVLLLVTTILLHYQRAAVRTARLRWLREADRALVYSLMARAVGVTRDTFERVLTLRPDGSAQADFSYTVRAVGQRVDFVEQQTTLPTNPDDKAADSITAPTFYVRDRQHRIERHQMPAGRTLVYKIYFIPALTKGNKVHVEGKGMLMPERSYALRRSDLPSGQTFDYSAVRPAYPSDRFRIEIRFPTGFAPDRAYFDVWIGDGRTRHEDEYTRIRAASGFEYTGDLGTYATAILDVEYPVPGLHYLVCWEPRA
jgi:hypothetical protein